MSPIKNVAVIGGSGNLGPAIVSALVDARFNVTALTRFSSQSTFPSAVRVHKTDYNSSESLAAAFKGQDAVVSVIASGGVRQQQRIIDAAVQAGVQRFIPSEFGTNTQKLGGGFGKIAAGKPATVAYLRKTAAENPGFSWTGISTSIFFDWGLQVGTLGFFLPRRTAVIFDSGNEPFTGSNLGQIGRSVVQTLTHPSETANKYLDVASFTTTQNEILALLEKESGEKWNVLRASTDDSLKMADEKLARGDYSAFGHYAKNHLFRDGGGHVEPLANDLLELPEEDLEETIRAALA